MLAEWPCDFRGGGGGGGGMGVHTSIPKETYSFQILQGSMTPSSPLPTPTSGSPMPAHKSSIVTHFFLNTVSVLPHPPHSPGLALFVFSFSEAKISSRVADILTEMLWSQLFFPLYQDYAKKTINVLFLKLDERLKLYIKIKIRG